MTVTHQSEYRHIIGPQTDLNIPFAKFLDIDRALRVIGEEIRVAQALEYFAVRSGVRDFDLAARNGVVPNPTAVFVFPSVDGADSVGRVVLLIALVP